MARSLIQIDDYELPDPTTYTAICRDEIVSNKNVSAQNIGAIVREDVASVSATYDYLSIETWSYILKLFNSRYGGSPIRDVTFFDQVSNSWVTREMTIGERTTGGVIRKDRATGRPLGVVKAKLELTEN